MNSVITRELRYRNKEIKRKTDMRVPGDRNQMLKRGSEIEPEYLPLIIHVLHWLLHRLHMVHRLGMMQRMHRLSVLQRLRLLNVLHRWRRYDGLTNCVRWHSTEPQLCRREKSRTLCLIRQLDRYINFIQISRSHCLIETTMS